MNILEQLKKAKATAPKERSESVKVETGTTGTSTKKEYQDPYFESKILSNSGIKSFNKDGTKKEGFASAYRLPSYRFGSLSDAYMTEPFLYEHQMSPTQWEELQIWKQFEALKAHPEASNLLGEEYFQYIKFSHNFKGDELSSEYKSNYKGNTFELQRWQQGYYKWKDYRVPMRGKQDVYNKNLDIIIDLKTTTQQDRKSILRSANQMGYWTQPDIYTSICKKAKDFIFIFVTYASYEMFEKAKLGNKAMGKAVMDPCQVHIVKWSQLSKEKIMAKRMIHDQLSIIEKFQPELLK